MNKITVAQEHYSSAGTQFIMSLVLPHDGKAVGADGYAPNADAAIAVANRRAEMDP
jgi:hypothetical protein